MPGVLIRFLISPSSDDEIRDSVTFSYERKCWCTKMSIYLLLYILLLYYYYYICYYIIIIIIYAIILLLYIYYIYYIY